MPDWMPTRLGDCVEVLDHLRVPVNSDERAKRKGTVPYYGANGQQGWIDEALFDEPLVLLAEDGGNFDGFTTQPIAYRIDGPSWVNNHAHVVRAVGGAVDQGFLFWSLVNRDIRRFIAGGTRSKLTQGELRSIELDLPPLPEQRRIAEILDTVDELIRKTEQLIAKLKQVKQGLLHDLLTRGIDDNGELRDPDRHPEQFKDSPLGRIPKGWKQHRLLDLVELPSGQLDPRTQPYSGWPLVAPDHIESGSGRLLHVQTAAQQGAISGKYGFQTGDVLYTKIRPYLRKAALANFEGLCSADMYPLRPGNSLRPRFLLAVILGEAFSRFAESVSTRSGFPKINREEMGEYELWLPSVAEQGRVVSALAAMDRREALEDRKLKKLGLLKQGLLEDLLTGRVRTSCLEGAW